MDEVAADSRSADSLQPLPDDLLREILLRLPPEPIYLFRASLFSKHWRGLVHDAGFLRRFNDFHGGTPPVLGFFNNQPGPPLFVRTAGAFQGSTVATMSHRDWWAFDCRHGRALLENKDSSALLVLDILTGEEHYLPTPPAPPCGGVFNGAVLRATGHGDCHSCPFLVVYVGSPDTYVAGACVYTSETGVWTDFSSIEIPSYSVDAKPTALVGNTLYWLLDNCCIIEFDLDDHRLGLTERIPYDDLCSYGEILLMPTEDGLLGLAGAEHFNYLHLWSMAKSIDGVVTWTRQRVIDLNKLISPQVLSTCTTGVDAIGFAQDAGVIFIYLERNVYMIHLKSMQIKEVSEKGSYSCILPYTSFYSPGTYFQCPRAILPTSLLIFHTTATLCMFSIIRAVVHTLHSTNDGFTHPPCLLPVVIELLIHVFF
jgi:hypothetical protein